MSRMRRRYLTSAALLVLTGALVFHFELRGEDIAVSVNLSELPSEMSSWKGKDQDLTSDVLGAINADGIVFRNYTDGQNVVNLFVSYYKSQRKESLAHTPPICYPAQGFTILQSGIEDISVTGKDLELETINLGPGSSIQVGKLVAQRGDERHLVLYWYQSRHDVQARDLTQRLSLILARLKGERNDRALVRVSSVVNGNSADAALAYQKKFVESLFPELTRLLPH